MESVKQSKEAGVEENREDLDNILAKQAEMAKNSDDWRQGGCEICKFPRTPHQRLVQKHRLCTFSPYVI